MTAALSHRLDGLEPDNLLAFLALLGLLRTLEAADRNGSAANKLHPRAAWDIDHPPVRPRLFLSRAVTREELTEVAARELDALAATHDFGGRKDLNYTQAECRAILERAALSASADARGYADLLAALMTDVAIKDNRKGKDQSEQTALIDSTPLCLLAGSGHQHFLERLAEVPSRGIPKKNRSGKKAAARSAADCLAAALFQPWQRSDHLTSSFRWDPDEDIRYALMAGDPTDAQFKAGTQYGANRLAAVGLAVLTVVPNTSGKRVRPAVISGMWATGSFSIAWPVWREPATLPAIRALLSHSDLRKPDGLAHLGVDYVVVAQRIERDEYRNFARARPLQ